MKKLSKWSLLLVVITAINQAEASQVALRDTIQVDSAFTDLLLPENPIGISGADGSISIDLGQGKSLFLWGDSFLGPIKDNIRQQPSKFILGNTATLMSKDSIRSLYSGNFDQPSSFIDVKEEEKGKYWYWPGDAIIYKEKLLVFMAKYSKKANENGPFAFQYEGCDFLLLDPVNYNILDRSPFIAGSNPIHYGHAILRKDNVLYIYGSKADNKNFRSELHVMRARIKGNRLEKLEYWNGSNWVKEADKSQAIKGINSMVSEQFSVREINGKIVLLNQDRYQIPGKILSYIADNFQGPFAQEKLLYQINEPDLKSDSLFTYNAMFHPQIRRNNSLLVSYNVNTYSERLWWKKASVYRPRFIWIPIDSIFN